MNESTLTTFGKQYDPDSEGIVDDTLTWDLIEVSEEEFRARIQQGDNVEASMNATDSEFVFQVHYTDIMGVYYGTVGVDDDGTHYLVPSEVPDETQA